MAGTGDFNLRHFFRALGIKNPEPSVREDLQPVILAGDFRDIVPQYRAPSAVWGGDVNPVALERGFYQVTSVAPGGTLVHAFGSDEHTNFGIVAAALPATQLNPAITTCISSARAPDAIVSTGTIVANPFNPGLTPTAAATTPDRLNLAHPGLWIPPGQTFVNVAFTVNAQLTDWYVWVSDCPAGEHSVL